MTAFRQTAVTLLALALAAAAGLASGGAAETYQTPEAYIAETFGTPPPSDTIWLSGDLRDQVTDILTHPPRRIRERYWRDGERSLWIMEEIGKERPITMGFVVDKGRLSDARVLIYRESRGWEIRLPRFTQQFAGATLEGDLDLDRSIDGITGATLSVRAMQRLARVALLLHEKVVQDTGGKVDSAQAGAGVNDTP